MVAALTMLIGVLGAISQGDIKRILSFHIVSQIGYMVMGLAIGGAAGIAATVFYLVHHIPTKTSLFLVEGVVEDTEGTGTLDRLGGLARRSGPLALLFALPALSLAGLPPFSGFVGKLGLIQAGVDDRQWLLVGVALLVSLLTVVSMAKIWLGAFWGSPEPTAPRARGPRHPAPPEDHGRGDGDAGRGEPRRGHHGRTAVLLLRAHGGGPHHARPLRVPDPGGRPVIPMRRFLPWVAVLTLIWVLLNGGPTVANVLAGLAVSTLVMVAFPLVDPPSSHHVHPWGVLRFVGFVGWSLVTSSAQVVVTSLFPNPARLRSGIVRVELPGATPLITTLVANAITLTPGTLTVTAHSDPAVIHVHALGLGDLDEFRDEVHDLQRRATAAVTPVPEEVAR